MRTLAVDGLPSAKGSLIFILIIIWDMGRTANVGVFLRSVCSPLFDGGSCFVCGIYEIDVSLCFVSGDSVLYSISFFLLFLFLIFDTFVHVFFLYKNKIF